MKKLIKLAKILLASSILFMAPANGSVKSIKKISTFYKKINKDLVIAHFYFKDKKVKKNKELYNKYKHVNAVFKATESIEDEVHFIKINIERSHLKNLAKSYDITRTPTFILFRFGKKIATLSGLAHEQVTVDRLKKFIWDYFEDEIIEKIKKRAAREEELARQRRFYYYYYGHPYNHPFYYPPGYWGPHYYPYGWHRPYRHGGVHFGVGFRIH